jgi:hypothetical protein
MSVFVLTGLLLSGEDGFFQLESHLRIHDVKPEVAVNIYVSINECLVEKKNVLLNLFRPFVLFLFCLDPLFLLLSCLDHLFYLQRV